jgi:hypothetical protein
MPSSQIACARLRAGLLAKPDDIKFLELKIKSVNRKIQELSEISSLDNNELYFLYSCINHLTLKLQGLECQWLQELDLINKIIDSQAIVQTSIANLNSLKNDLDLLQDGSALVYLDLHNQQFL